MIQITNVVKKYDDFLAVDHVNLNIKEGTVFGLIGTNGAGKSTMLRMMAGVFKPDEGIVTIDDMPIFDNPLAKSLVYFIADEPYFFNNSCPKNIEKYLRDTYVNFNQEEFDKYLYSFGLDKTRKISTYSKGMKKQLAIICGIAAGTKYLFCDETFDGLDPVMRQTVKSLMAQKMDERGLTPIIASHNLRELEDLCDHIGLLHKGGVLLSKELEDMKLNIQKVQCVLSEGVDRDKAFEGLNIMHTEQRGSLYTITIRGTREEILNHFGKVDTVFVEALPLSLEEIFISETEVVGYDVKKLILG